jgi:hypothetical protein
MMAIRNALKDITKFRGDTFFDEFNVPSGATRLDFLVRNKNGVPLFSLNSEQHDNFLKFEDNTGSLLMVWKSLLRIFRESTSKFVA